MWYCSALVYAGRWCLSIEHFGSSGRPIPSAVHQPALWIAAKSPRLPPLRRPGAHRILAIRRPHSSLYTLSFDRRGRPVTRCTARARLFYPVQDNTATPALLARDLARPTLCARPSTPHRPAVRSRPSGGRRLAVRRRRGEVQACVARSWWGCVGWAAIDRRCSSPSCSVAGAPHSTGAACRPDVPGLRGCLLYTSPSPRDRQKSRMPSSA